MKIETRCNSQFCPLNKHCANFSTDDKFNLVEQEFHISSEEDEQPCTCEGFEDKQDEEVYK